MRGTSLLIIILLLNWLAISIVQADESQGGVTVLPPVDVDVATVGLAVVAISIALCALVFATKRYKGEDGE